MALAEVSKYWWAIALRGVVAIILGILFLAWPGSAMTGVVFAFGIWAFLDGVSALAAAASKKGGAELIFEGISGIAIGILTWSLPGAAALVLYLTVTIWVMVTGGLKIASAIRMRHIIHHELWLSLSGVVSILFGVLLLVTPGLGLLVLATWIGVFAIFYGFLMIMFGLRVRTFGTVAV
jgi:uncharacterized membrane protein HdeD (DUF308 family)